MFKYSFVALAAGAALLMTADPAPAADVDAGEKIYQKSCKRCHRVEPGKHGVGPSLAGIYGSEAGSTDFRGYRGLKNVDFVWDEEKLDGYIADPKGFIRANTPNKSTTMIVVPPLKEEQRADVIAYLKTLSQ